MGRVRVAACQINTVVGDLEGNAARILDALAEAERGGADLAVFPELTVTGYPPEDLLIRPAFVADNLAVFDRIATATGPCAAVVGYVDTDGSGRLVNAAALCAGGTGARSLRQAPAPQLRGLRRAALVHTRARDRPTGSWWPVYRSGSPSARTCGSPADPWPSRPRPGPPCWSTSTPLPTRGGAATSACRCWRTGWPRPAVPSSTSTRSADRTSWSSTAPR